MGAPQISPPPDDLPKIKLSTDVAAETVPNEPPPRRPLCRNRRNFYICLFGIATLLILSVGYIRDDDRNMTVFMPVHHVEPEVVVVRYELVIVDKTKNGNAGHNETEATNREHDPVALDSTMDNVHASQLVGDKPEDDEPDMIDIMDDDALERFEESTAPVESVIERPETTEEKQMNRQNPFMDIYNAARQSYEASVARLKAMAQGENNNNNNNNDDDDDNQTTTTTTTTTNTKHNHTNNSLLDIMDATFAKFMSLMPKLVSSRQQKQGKNETTTTTILVDDVDTDTEKLLLEDDADRDRIVREKRDKVKEMMLHAWEGYKKHAWGKNELRPVTVSSYVASIFGNKDLGATIFESMDTLYLMGLTEEFEEGRRWIAKQFTLEKTLVDLSVSEMTTRLIAGLLSCYAFTGDTMFRDKAAYIANKLMPAFKTPTGIPNGLVNALTGTSKNYWWSSQSGSILAEFGALHLEFMYLTDVTGKPEYKERVMNIRRILKDKEKTNGLYQNYLNPRTGEWAKGRQVSFGAMGNNFYEYLLKAWIQSGYKDVEARQMYDDAMAAIVQHLVTTSPGGLTYISEMASSDTLEYKMYHLACFAGGMFALGGATLQTNNTDKYMELGVNITDTCHEAYIRAKTHLAPAVFRFTDGFEAQTLITEEMFNVLRPETIESYFYMWRLTHDQKYRDWGWDAVMALERHCRTENGYSGVRNVYVEPTKKDDVQQSYFMSGTLKYLYLLFSDDSLLPLHEWVFNTEGHPLPIKNRNPLYRA